MRNNISGFGGFLKFKSQSNFLTVNYYIWSQFWRSFCNSGYADTTSCILLNEQNRLPRFSSCLGKNDNVYISVYIYIDTHTHIYKYIYAYLYIERAFWCKLHKKTGTRNL